MQPEPARGARVRGMSESLPRPVGHPRETARQRFVGVRKLGKSPEAGQLLRQALHLLVDQLAPQPSCDEVHVGPGMAGAGSERARQALSQIVDALDRRSEDRLRLGPAADGEVEALAVPLDAAAEALLRAVRKLAQLGEQLGTDGYG